MLAPKELPMLKGSLRKSHFGSIYIAIYYLVKVLTLFIIFGYIYWSASVPYFSNRNKERLALIEKGADASIFVKGKSQTAPIWKVLILNFAFF